MTKIEKMKDAVDVTSDAMGTLLSVVYLIKEAGKSQEGLRDASEALSGQIDLLSEAIMSLKSATHKLEGEEAN